MEASDNTLPMLHRKLFSSSQSWWISCTEQLHAGLLSLILHYQTVVTACSQDYLRMLKLLLNLTCPHIDELHFSSTKRKKKQCSILNSMSQLIGWKTFLSFIYRFRLRKKTWKNPGTVFLDYHIYEEDINISSNWEVFLEILDGNNNTERKWRSW